MDRPYRGPAGPALASGTPVTANLPAAAAAPGTAKIIEARDLFLSFGETPALRGASLGVRQGEAWFAGQRLDTLSDDRRSALRRDRFGFVFQSGQLVPELTAEENVALPLLLSGVRRGPAMAEALGWFAVLGLDGLDRRRSGELSGGQAQRVALARGLVARPTVL